MLPTRMMPTAISCTAARFGAVTAGIDGVHHVAVVAGGEALRHRAAGSGDATMIAESTPVQAIDSFFPARYSALNLLSKIRRSG